MDDIRKGKIIEIIGDGYKKVIYMNTIEIGIDIMISSGKRYIITHYPIIQIFYNKD
jgi:hypothetical protein